MVFSPSPRTAVIGGAIAGVLCFGILCACYRWRRKRRRQRKQMRIQPRSSSLSLRNSFGFRRNGSVHSSAPGSGSGSDDSPDLSSTAVPMKRWALLRSMSKSPAALGKRGARPKATWDRPPPSKLGAGRVQPVASANGRLAWTAPAATSDARGGVGGAHPPRSRWASLRIGNTLARKESAAAATSSTADGGNRVRVSPLAPPSSGGISGSLRDLVRAFSKRDSASQYRSRLGSVADSDPSCSERTSPNARVSAEEGCRRPTRAW